MKASKATKSSEEIGSEGKFNSLMNETSYESLSFEAMKSKNESRDAAKMRVAYEEMQLKYLRLEKRYRDLGQQYRAQKQVGRFLSIHCMLKQCVSQKSIFRRKPYLIK